MATEREAIICNDFMITTLPTSVPSLVGKLVETFSRNVLSKRKEGKNEKLQMSMEEELNRDILYYPTVSFTSCSMQLKYLPSESLINSREGRKRREGGREEGKRKQKRLKLDHQRLVCTLLMQLSGPSPLFSLSSLFGSTFFGLSFTFYQTFASN